MLLDFTLTIIALAALLIASYTDIKTREVPDWISYGLIFASLGLRAIFAFTEGVIIFLTGVFGFAIFFILALLFYHTNQWGGGDAKLLMGMGAVIGIPYPFSGESFLALWFLMALLFLGAIYGLFYLIGIAIKQRRILAPALLKELDNKQIVHIGVIALSGTLFVLSLFIPELWILILAPLLLFYLLIFVTVVEKECFYTKIPIKKLTIGDWLAAPIKSKNKIILKKKTLEAKDIAFLRKRKIQRVTIKQGIPFVPSFVLAYVAILLWKDVFGLFLYSLF
jgi:Flp pilus assembly protein protease CpaA